MAMTGGTAYLVKREYANYGNADWLIDLYVYVVLETQSIGANSTTLKLGMFVDSQQRIDWSDFGGSYLGIGAYNGGLQQKKNFAAGTNSIGTAWLVEDFVVTVNHAEDGSCSAAPIIWSWGVNSPWGCYEKPSGTKTVELLTIPRASEPTVSANSIVMGDAVTIYTNRKAPIFTHTLQYSFDRESWTDIETGVTDSYKFATTIHMASNVTDDDEVTCIIRCKTFNGNTKIGEKDVELKLVVPENEDTKPDVSVTVSADNTDLEGNSKYNDLKGLYIQGVSKVNVKITANGKLNAGISSYATTVDGKTYRDADFTSDTLTGSDALIISAKVTDHRGISNTVSNGINVIPYSKPTVKPVNGNGAVVCSRCKTEDGMTGLRIAAKMDFYPVSDINTCTLRCAVKKYTALDYGDWIRLLSSDTSTMKEYNQIVENVELDTNTMYDVRIEVCDAFGNSDFIDFTIPTEEATLDLAEGGLNIAIGRRAKTDGSRSFDCAWNAYFEEGIYLGKTHISEDQLKELLGLLTQRSDNYGI